MIPKLLKTILVVAALVLALSCSLKSTPSPTAIPTPTLAPTASPTRAQTPSPTAPVSPTLTSTTAPSSTPTTNPTPTPIPLQTPLPDAPDRDLYSLAQRLRPGMEQPIERVVNPNPVTYQVGHQQVFWVADLNDKKMYQVEARLLLVSEHAYWYFQKGYEPPEAALRLAAQTFEETIYPVVTGAFGIEWSPGVDNDPHMTILHSPLNGVAGYFSASDEYPRAVYPFSNQREMIYMSTSSFSVGSRSYLGTLAHELQHAIHWAGDSGEETWVTEGLSEVAKHLAGYGFSFVDYFTASPVTGLMAWPTGMGSTLPHYGAASLFMEYLAQHYGGYDSIRALVARPEDGPEGVTAYLHSLDYQADFEDVFRDWLVANYLDSRDIAPYTYAGLDIGIKPQETLAKYGRHTSTVPQYAGEYVEIRLKEGDAKLSFQGQTEIPLLPTSAYSGSHCWWGNRGDSMDSTLTTALDLSPVSQATLSFWAWYAIEESWDYAYVEVSTDGGKTWNILEGSLTSPENPLGTGFGPGYTGESNGWQKEIVDLTPYAGTKVLLRFEYVTDDAINEDGICIDDISIPEIGYFDDAEGQGQWDAQGFVRSDNRVPQRYLVRVIEVGPQGVTVLDMPADRDGKGELVLQGFGAGLERAIVIVAPLTPKTTQPATYVLSVEPVP